ncbi:torsin-1A-interacting protein 1-like isoform X2 [Bufo bufo]|uniref:torsin-1A-interacting protein 1-like isoform X2 n=1 Tax=Bufo bufo TaxID=8384 RepID=UPI001ABE77DC|nr:torsin-1A-interacting protein 1-like isoform X2 [Bufo bufo]
MASRRRGANTGISSPGATSSYSLRDRTRGKGDVSALSRLAIKNAGKETKDQPVEEKNVKNKSRRETSRRAPKPVEPDSDNDSEDGSENSDNSRGGLSNNGRQSKFTPTKASSGSSANRQPSEPRPFTNYTADENLVRPRIRPSHDSAKKQPSQARQVTEDTEDVEEKRHYYKGEPWRGTTNTQPFRSSSEDRREEFTRHHHQPKVNTETQPALPSKLIGFSDDEEKPATRPQRKADPFIERTQYKEMLETWRSPDRREEFGTRHHHQPKVNTETQPALPSKLMGFSDDEEKPATRPQRKAVSFPIQNRMNHNPKKDVEQKGNLSRKPRTHFSRYFAACMKYFVPALLLVLAVGVAAVLYISPEVQKDLKDDFENLTSVFTNQSPLMWKRSRVILERHLENWKKNTEPAILLLTGARDAEQTLLCIGTQLADIYSSSLGGNYTVISGSNWASESSEVVKAHIDDHLSAHFQAKTSAAILHRLELLPSGSLLILYKYCDHESAVFKNVMLLFTVLLDEATLAKDIPLNDLEETVREFLIDKLIGPETENAASHDWMDRDKFSGVWSRISHVVLPVFPEETIPEQCVKKPI